MLEAEGSRQRTQWFDGTHLHRVDSTDMPWQSLLETLLLVVRPLPLYHIALPYLLHTTPDKVQYKDPYCARVRPRHLLVPPQAIR